MASENGRQRRRHTSATGDVIKFEPSENPPWREETPEVPSVRDMIANIVHFQHEWNSNKENYDASAVKRVQEEFRLNFFYHCNKEEEHGFETLEDTKECLSSSREYSELSKEEKETVNLKDAYEYLLRMKAEETETDCHGLIEESMLRKANKLILRDAYLRRGQTKPGHFSNEIRLTTYKGEVYEYQCPTDMCHAVTTLLDQCNSLFQESQNEADLQNSEEDNLCKLFKVSSWFLYEMLDLHPFADGNGRLCRLLCSYVLSTCTPFPTPIYNIWSTSSKKDYINALVETRKSETRHPKALATMIIECNWSGWKEFMKKVDPQSISQKTKRNALKNEEETSNLVSLLDQVDLQKILQLKVWNEPVSLILEQTWWHSQDG